MRVPDTPASSSLTVQPMFPVAFALERHPAPERLNAALRALFLAREPQPDVRNPHPYTERNAALFESRFDLFQWPQPEIAEVRELCLSRTLQLVQRLNGYSAEQTRALRLRVESWFHITRRNGYFGVHNHPNASWSGVYCVDGGRPDPGCEDSGQLSFLHPLAGSAMYVDVGNAELKPPFNVQHLGYVLRPGDLVLFPSWLLHQVTPFFGEGERITIAFNCAFPP
jgi:uncharacterized protein (TIGR02466 family)